MHVRKNDTVLIKRGAHRGQSGKVIKVFPEEGRVIVEGRNMIKRHTKPRQTNPKGGILEKEAPMSVSNVMLVCPKCSRPSRTGIKVLEDRRKIRTCKKCGEMVE